MDTLRKVIPMIGVAGLGLVAGFLFLSFVMPPQAPPRSTALQTVQPAGTAEAPKAEEPPAQATSPAARAPSPSAAAQASATPKDDLHNPDSWTLAQGPPPKDNDVEFDDVGTPSPQKPPKKPSTPQKQAPQKETPQKPHPAPQKQQQAGSLRFDTSRARNLATWKPAITNYSRRHYGEATWQLQPTCIVLHFTAGTNFPENLASSNSFDGEAPGLASHYVIDGTHIWQLVPPDVRSRGAYGINHRAINIEMIAADAHDLARRPTTLQTCVALVKWLMETYNIDKSHIYSHTAVSHMSTAEVPEVKDLVDPRPYGKPDPGEQNLQWVKARL